MFSGIIEDIGTVVSVATRGAGRDVRIRTALPVGSKGETGIGASRDAVGLGDSIAVMGACLTVEAVEPPHGFTVVAGRETVERTTLGGLTAGTRVHLERALRLSGRLDGHLVAGHVDGVGRITDVVRQQESVVLRVEAPVELSRYVAEKGSISLDGVSLTVNEIRASSFRVNIIPFTAEHTLLGSLRLGDRVNLEVDLLARYVERLLGTPAQSGGLSAARLVELGYGARRTGGS